jgi:glycosidase
MTVMTSITRRTALALTGATGATLALPTMSATTNTLPAAVPVIADMPHLPWTRQATIYQINIRQYSAAGTFQAVQADLPRLQKLGVGILWLMPVQPIGKLNRKGGLGSYYAISDYTAVNPEFGSLADAKAFVAEAQQRGMKVILDWVANHTAWDHPWATAHKDWYQLNAQGELFPVTFGEGASVEYWTDVIALNYRQPALREAMVDAMKFWVREVGMDGFRCDVASLVPTDFWVRARRELDAVKPMFMLAESDAVDLHTSGAFDMTYAWDLPDTVFKKVGKGEAGVPLLREWLARQPGGYPPHAYRMRFTNNHDFNSWHGTDAELYGDAYLAFAVLTFTLPGMPLIYNGQESRLAKRLAFFEKDPIAWGRYELSDFYARLVALKRKHPALAAGQYGAPVTLLPSPPGVFAFERRLGADAVKVAVNLTATPQTFQGQALKPWGWWLGTPA